MLAVSTQYYTPSVTSKQEHHKYVNHAPRGNLALTVSGGLEPESLLASSLLAQAANEGPCLIIRQTLRQSTIRLLYVVVHCLRRPKAKSTYIICA